VTLGSPPQSLTLLIDTNTRYLVVNVPESPQCLSGQCSKYGTYDAGISSTSQFVNASFGQDDDPSGGYPSGNYTRDTLQIGDIQLKNFTFGTTSSYNQTGR
jgi:hypothetical protein